MITQRMIDIPQDKKQTDPRQAEFQILSLSALCRPALGTPVQSGRRHRSGLNSIMLRG